MKRITWYFIQSIYDLLLQSQKLPDVEFAFYLTVDLNKVNQWYENSLVIIIHE